MIRVHDLQSYPDFICSPKTGIFNFSRMLDLTRVVEQDASFNGVETDQLLERLKEGDEAAFAELFQLYKDMVYTLAHKLLVDKTEAMDVTQEVFINLFRRVDGFRGECSLKTWVYRIALNQAANRNRWWKRRSRDHALSLSLDQFSNENFSYEISSRNPSPARQMLDSEIRVQFMKGLDQLSFDQRVAVILRDVEGLSCDEISEITDVQIGTVKSRIARGREHLRSLLKDFKGAGRI